MSNPLEIDPPAPRQRIVLVTGASGAGRSTALGVLEDLGFEAIR
ncbi:RNase adaptor protein RapZ, partial [Rhodovulum sulfidophilum]|nr:RNase adaptor protein RapZ [Rhodovulum sulfidophilum]